MSMQEARAWQRRKQIEALVAARPSDRPLRQPFRKHEIGYGAKSK
jgi:hypothetical protein